MKKRTTGVAFIFIAALLFISRYITAAIWCAGAASKTGFASQMFNNALDGAGTDLLTCSIISLGIGIGYLIIAEKSKE